MPHSVPKYTVRLASSNKDLHGILALQQKNHRKNLTPNTAQTQGFVTVEHNFELLKRMHDAEAHVIGVDENDDVVGYCLSMRESFRSDIPVLFTMFDLLDKLEVGGETLKQVGYIVMGQLCVAQSHRGCGLVDELFKVHGKHLHGKYGLSVTEVARRNVRSLKVHERAGYRIIHEYKDDADDWLVVAWDLNNL
eukprot:comp5651_c0_seq1/m.1546 comp5651_c0_seq1/g.1546  ORF comp5651_c0_seq1/g.1546 comp5651_c0_seq1/m.1546 type:complete len:193 (-) comp5651_c0_seq1:553-1131(-)